MLVWPRVEGVSRGGFIGELRPNFRGAPGRIGRNFLATRGRRDGSCEMHKYLGYMGYTYVSVFEERRKDGLKCYIRVRMMAHKGAVFIRFDM